MDVALELSVDLLLVYVFVIPFLLGNFFADATSIHNIQHCTRLDFRLSWMQSVFWLAFFGQIMTKL